MGRAKSSILIPIINAVIVVPMLAPMITPIACRKVISPALTKPTVMTVVPEEVWISTVTTMPTMTPLIGLDVYLARSSRDFISGSFLQTGRHILNGKQEDSQSPDETENDVLPVHH